jgi:hypothetical protein
MPVLEQRHHVVRTRLRNHHAPPCAARMNFTPTALIAEYTARSQPTNSTVFPPMGRTWIG